MLYQSLQFWRVRLAVLPLQKPTSEKSSSSDAEEQDNEVQFKYLQGFLRFLETVNRIRRPPVTKVQVGSKNLYIFLSEANLKVILCLNCSQRKLPESHEDQVRLR